NHEANLQDLFDCFDQFVESLKNKYTILNKLPTDSYPIKYDIKWGKPVDGEEYYDDIGTLKLSDKVCTWIAERLRDGLNIKGINQIFKKKSQEMDNIWTNRNQETAVLIKDFLVIQDDIYNIWKDVALEEQIKHKSEQQ
ncbi:22578_t:CDS:2, partial [Racocetra persica]